MPRGNKEAEDEAYAKALQEEYRKEFIERQMERIANQAIGNTATSSEQDSGDRLTTTNTNNSSRRSKKKNSNNDTGSSKGGDRKKKKSKGKGKKKSKSKSSKSRSRSSSQDSYTSTSGRGDRRRRQRGSGSNMPSAPIESGSDWLSAYHPQQEDQCSTPPPYVGNENDPTKGDEEYARMIQTMIHREEESGRQLPEESPNQRSLLSERAASARLSDEHCIQRQSSFKDSNSAGGTEPSTDDDEAVARRIQQELADAEYAQHISNLERENAASQQVVLSLERQNQLNLAQQEQEEQQKKSCVSRWGPISVCVIIAVAIPILYILDVFDYSDIPFVGDLFQDDWAGAGNITFDLINGTRVPRLPPNAISWANTGNGLRLDVVNSCSDEWQPYVQTAIANWDNGFPIDSLTLYTSREYYDSECEVVTGKLKICNGDYGDTRWRGLNEVLMSPRHGTIVASTAKLNEFYLNYESEAQKLYTCCHELGHGFGLPHWDEDFFNKDIGNCMDYTHNPGSSSTPDDSNFMYLAQLYGGLDVRNNEYMTADDAVVIFGQKEEISIDTARSNSKTLQDVYLGHRKLFGGSGSLRNNGYNNHRDGSPSIPLTESRLKLDDTTLQGASPTRRRILQADEDAEIHVYEDPRYPGLVVMQHFLLVEPGWRRPP